MVGPIQPHEHAVAVASIALLRFMSALQELHPDMLYRFTHSDFARIRHPGCASGPRSGRVVETIDGGCEPSSS